MHSHWKNSFGFFVPDLVVYDLDSIKTTTLEKLIKVRNYLDGKKRQQLIIVSTEAQLVYADKKIDDATLVQPLPNATLLKPFSYFSASVFFKNNVSPAFAGAA